MLGPRLVALSEKQAGVAAEEKAAADGPSSDGDGERLEPNQIRPGGPAQDVSQQPTLESRQPSTSQKTQGMTQLPPCPCTSIGLDASPSVA